MSELRDVGATDSGKQQNRGGECWAALGAKAVLSVLIRHVEERRGKDLCARLNRSGLWKKRVWGPVPFREDAPASTCAVVEGRRSWTAAALCRFSPKTCEPDPRPNTQRLRIIILCTPGVGSRPSPKRLRTTAVQDAPATPNVAGEFRQVVDCGSPLPLFSENLRAGPTSTNPALAHHSSPHAGC